MKFPLSWLKEYIAIELPPQEIAKLLTFAGIEVDAFEKAKMSFDKVVVGEVVETSPHPNADKLTIAKVFDGVQTYQVVCGAPNCRKGIKSPLALIGATLQFPDGEVLKVKKSKLRGEESQGMLCSGDELGLPSDLDGIMEFAQHIPVGYDVSELYSDTIFEVSLTPNLTHAASLWGIARELSALTGLPLKAPQTFKADFAATKPTVSIKIEDEEDCPRYGFTEFELLNEVDTPQWMKNRLLACGQRSINLAADISNYALLEFGHPLHAFDRSKIAGDAIVVRKAKQGELLQTLDGKERILSPEMLLIADVSKPLAVAGVMGGENSEVSSTTKKIVLEGAYFRPGSVRKTSKALGLSTDAAKRFERGVDPNAIDFALNRALELFQITAGLKTYSEVEIQSSAEFEPKKIVCRLSRVNGLLGTQVSLSEVEDIFKRLGFACEWDGQDAYLVTVPTFRVDIQAEVDLIEEVARLVGYENIPRKQAGLHSSQIPHTPLFEFEREVRKRLIGEGLQEFLTCDLIGPTLLEKAPETKLSKESMVQVLNPTSIEQSILRASLLQGLLEVMKFNYDHDNKSVLGFEIGKVHFKEESGYKEPLVLGIAVMGDRTPYHMDPKPGKVDFYDLKGVIENLFTALNIKRYTFRSSQQSTFHSGRQASIQVDGEDVGTMGEIHPEILRKLDIEERLYFAEINLSDLFRAKRGALKMKPLPAYPSSERDWTVTVEEELPVQQLIGSIEKIPSRLLESVSLVDIFRGEKVGYNKKNVTLHFVYRDLKKTVEQEEVDGEHAKITAAALHMMG